MHRENLNDVLHLMKLMSRNPTTAVRYFWREVAKSIEIPLPPGAQDPWVQKRKKPAARDNWLLKPVKAPKKRRRKRR